MALSVAIVTTGCESIDTFRSAMGACRVSCSGCSPRWRHHGHDSAVQPGRPSLHHPSSHHQGLRLRAVMPGGQRAGNDCSKCAHMSTITRLRLDAALHEPAASRDPGQGGRLRRKGVTPALTQKHPQPPAFTSSTRPQPPAHHVEVIALKTSDAGLRRPPPRCPSVR